MKTIALFLILAINTLTHFCYACQTTDFKSLEEESTQIKANEINCCLHILCLTRKPCGAKIEKLFIGNNENQIILRKIFSFLFDPYKIDGHYLTRLRDLTIVTTLRRIPNNNYALFLCPIEPPSPLVSFRFKHKALIIQNISYRSFEHKKILSGKTYRNTQQEPITIRKKSNGDLKIQLGNNLNLLIGKKCGYSAEDIEFLLNHMIFGLFDPLEYIAMTEPNLLLAQSQRDHFFLEKKAKQIDDFIYFMTISLTKKTCLLELEQKTLENILELFKILFPEKLRLEASLKELQPHRAKINPLIRRQIKRTSRICGYTKVYLDQREQDDEISRRVREKRLEHIIETEKIIGTILSTRYREYVIQQEMEQKLYRELKAKILNPTTFKKLSTYFL